ncbi:hypothetical protein LCGC14_1028660 [marine sediment metagenome]|uniref:Chaperone DnaJ C-terminal domain-containing protein n=1 Tax=marine sediment metagenome TaxID=412755 RepID=A0A0F9R127_9ZZZZ
MDSPDREFPSINEWLDSHGIDRAYKKDMKETYQREKAEAQLVKRQELCPACAGTGQSYYKGIHCPRCQGTGAITSQKDGIKD